MSVSLFSFDEDQFNRLFPFYLLIDADSGISKHGKSLAKILTLTTQKKSFNDYFKIIRPKIENPSFDELKKLVNQLLVVEIDDKNKVNLKGQFEYIKSTNQLLFVGSPWFDTVEEITNAHLSLHDFAIHDPLIDLLHVLKTQEIVNDDIKKLLKTLNNQRDELKRLSLIAEETINGVVVTDAKARIQWVNKSFEKITGYSLVEVIGKVPGTFLQGKETEPEIKNYLREQVNNAQPFECEILNYKKDGTPYWVKISGQPLFDKSGKLTQFFALEEDITERKENEQKILNFEKRFRVVLEKIGDNYWEHDFTTGQTYFSSMENKFLGFSAEEFADNTQMWRKQIHPDDKHLLNKIDAGYRNGSINSHAIEYRLFTKSGSIMWVLDRGVVVEKSPFGNPIKTVGTHTDITSLKETEESLKQAEERWQFALEGAGDGVWEYNFQTGEVYFSPGYKRMLGYNDSNFKNEVFEWTSRIHPEDLYQIELTDKEYETGAITHHEREYRIKNIEGEYIWILDRGMVISRTLDSKPLRLIGTHTNVTQRKLIALSLEQSEKQFRSLSENIPGVVYEYIFRPDGTHGYKFISPVIEKIFGISAKEFAESGKYIHPYDQKILFEKREQSKKTNEGFSYEGRIITPHKGIMWHSATSSFSYEMEDGSRIFTGIILDITEKKLAERKLEEQRRFYEDILNQIPADIAVFDANHTYLFLNPVAIKDPELRKWFIGKRDEDYCKLKNKPMSIAEGRRATFNKVVESKKLNFWEEKLTGPDGKPEYHLRNMYPVLDEKGEIKLVIGYGMNITERKNIEEKLKLNEKRYRDLFNYSQALICTHDLNGIILSVNPAICDALGYTGDELLGKNLISFIPPKEQEFFKPEYLDKIIAEEKVNGVFRVMRKDGSKLFLLYQNYKVREEGLEPYVIGFSQDITERVKAENELVLAKKMTDEASYAKEIFLANMSHEIRTPMSGILGVAGLLAKTNLDRQQKNYAKLITESANNLLVIVNDVLDIEKIASGKFEFESVHFKISEKITTTIQSFQYKAEEKGLTLDFTNNLPNDLILLGDPYRLSQVLNNLLSNALKFTQEGKIIITASLLEKDDNKVTIQFSVKDTGIGIPDDRLSVIFDPFVQASTDTTRKYGGTGLGLSICKNLVEMQGGNITAHSEENVDTTFTFTIPYTIGSVDLLAEELKIEVNFSDMGKKRILVAEDVELNQFLAKHILESWGFSVDIANNGKEAVDCVQQKHYDLILMDIQMPEMDGIVATQTIRKLSDTAVAGIPIIALTANALKGDDQRYLNAGMNDYITKPYTEERLYKVISKYLKATENNPSTKNKTENFTPAEPAAATEEKIYDLSMVNVIGKNNPAFVKTMIKLFLDTIPLDLKKLQDAATNEEWEKVGFTAHKMKSTIDSMGISTISNTIRKLELKGEMKETKETILAMVNDVSTVLEKVIAQMRIDFPDIH
jgi:PAS domain S-box-containing protein